MYLFRCYLNLFTHIYTHTHTRTHTHTHTHTHTTFLLPDSSFSLPFTFFLNSLFPLFSPYSLSLPSPASYLHFNFLSTCSFSFSSFQRLLYSLPFVLLLHHYLLLLLLHLLFFLSIRGLNVDLNPLAVKEEYQNLSTQSPYPGLKKAIRFLKEELNAKELWDRVGWNVTAMIESVS